MDKIIFVYQKQEAQTRQDSMPSNLTPIKSVKKQWKTQVFHVSDLIANTHFLLDEYQVSFSKREHKS